jgi:ethanolamine ammonia-lyase small subunit
MSEPEHSVPGADSLPMVRANSPLNLRNFTSARVALERAGSSISTRAALEFSLAHAQARDAVHSALGVQSLMTVLREQGLSAIAVRSAAAGRIEYLLRPDLGRVLSSDSTSLLAQLQTVTCDVENGTRVSIILADGLSALATERHALPLLDVLLRLLGDTWAMSAIVVAEQARVALGDEIGVALRAEATVMLIGERPGLSAPDSLGAYITWSPRPGRTDAERNCVSNIRIEGLDYTVAAEKIAWYLSEGRRLGTTGVQIRENDSMGWLQPPKSTARAI